MIKKIITFVAIICIGFILFHLRYYAISSNTITILTTEDVEITETIKDPFLFEACLNWQLSKKDVKNILKHSHTITSIERHAIYYYLPCTIAGTLKKNNKFYSYQINAAANLILTSNTDIEYYGCSKAECEKYFLMMPDNYENVTR